MRYTILTTSTLAVALTCSLLLAVTPAAAQVSFRTLGADANSRVNALSADGTVAVGSIRYGYGSMPCAWDSRTGELIQFFGYVGRGVGANTAYAITTDGSAAVGYTEYDPVLQAGGAMRWSVDAPHGAAVALPPGPRGYRGWDDGARGISADASTIIGQSGGQAVRWTSAGAEAIVPSEIVYSRATAITPDGATAIGFYTAGDDFSALRAFSWSSSGGVRDLPGFPCAAPTSWASGISADGRTIVGYSGSNSGGVHLTRWTVDSMTQTTHAEDLAAGTSFMPIWLGTAAISANGLIIGGSAKLSDDPEAVAEAVIWTNELGLVSLTDLLSRSGIIMPIDPSTGTSVRLSEITSISADGCTIAGNYFFSSGGYDTPEFGFIATIPAPGYWGVFIGGVLWRAQRLSRERRFHHL